MVKRFVLTVMSLLFITGILPAVQADSSAASCRDECYSSCCGDEGICNGDDEEACVSDCLRDCDDSVPVITAPGTADDGENADGGKGGSEGNAEGN